MGNFCGDKRVVKTKRRIREVFHELMLENDLSSITISAIARRAEIDRKTFYAHYSSVGDLIDEIVSDLEEDVQSLLAEMDQFSVSRFFNGLNAITLKNQVFFRHVCRSPSYNFFLLRFKGLLKKALLSIFPADSDINPDVGDICAEYASAGIISVYNNWLVGERNIPIETLSLIAQEIFDRSRIGSDGLYGEAIRQ